MRWRNKMQIEILSRNQAEQFLRKELLKIEDRLFKELDKMREKILRLEEENKLLRRLLK